MRKDFLLFLSFLVDAGYIVSFRVTILHCGGCKGFRFRFFLLTKPGRLWLVCPAEGGKKQPGNGAEIMKTPLYIYLITAEVIAAARLVLVPSKGNRRNGIAGAVREERPPQVKVH